MFFYAFFSLTIITCNNNSDSVSANSHSDTPKSDKLIRYVEADSVKGTRKEAFLTNFSNILGLPKIRNGFDGLYIRIWIWEPGRNYVININVNKACDISQFSTKLQDSVDFIDIAEKWTKVVPNSGWKEFQTHLNKNNIIDNKGGASITKYQDLLREWHMFSLK